MPSHSTDTSSGYDALAVTTSDSVDLSKGKTRGLYVGVGGDVVAVIDGNAITFKNVATGAILPVQCTRVNATSTTATNIVALY